MIFFPFSPRWLMLRGREDEALAVVSQLRRRPIDDPIVRLEFLEIKAMVQFDAETAAEKFPGKKGWKLDAAQYGVMFTQSGMRKRMAIGCVLQFFQQFTGINAIIVSPPSLPLQVN